MSEQPRGLLGPTWIRNFSVNRILCLKAALTVASSISPKVTRMPLAMAAAAPITCSIFDAIPFSVYHPRPAARISWTGVKQKAFENH